MNCDVLIYGFGVTGKHVLKICKAFGYTYKIVDDFALRLSRDFVFLEDLKEVKLVLICLNDKEKQEKAKEKLLQTNFDCNIIKVINLGDFRNSYLETFCNRFDCIDFISTLLEDDYNLSKFNKIYKEIIKQYKENKVKEAEFRKELIKKAKLKYPNLNTFAKIFATSQKENDNDMIHYPYFHVFTDRASSDKNFFFREKVDFQTLKNRDKNTKLVLCFGSSVMRADEVALESTIAKRLETLLNTSVGGGGSSFSSYKVLNLGISGYSTPDMCMLYLSLFEALSPDIVVSIFFGNELITASVCDDSLLRDSQLYYHPFLENECKSVFDSGLPLCYDFREHVEQIDYNLILKSIAFRIDQFSRVVESSKARFYAFITPLLQQKIHKTQEEILGQEQALKTYPSYYFSHLKHQESLLKEFKEIIKIKVYDANYATFNSRETLFLDWIHLNSRGCSVVGEYMYQVIKQ